MTLLNFDVRFTPESGHSPTRSGCLLWATSGLMHRNTIGETLTYRDGRVGGDTLLGLLPAFPSGNVELYEDFIGT